MALPGLIIQYSHLWHSEFLQGRDEGVKDRPCAIIAAIREDEDGATRVLVLPHSPPHDDVAAVEIPATVKRRLKLDDARSWIVLGEWNEFGWPGPDLRRAPGADDSWIAYGMLPPRLFAAIRDRFLLLVNAGTAAPVKRT